MPLVEVKMLAGRSHDVKYKLVRRITETVVETLGSKPDAVTVILTDVPREDWARAGILMSDRESPK